LTCTPTHERHDDLIVTDALGMTPGVGAVRRREALRVYAASPKAHPLRDAVVAKHIGNGDRGDVYLPTLSVERAEVAPDRPLQQIEVVILEVGTEVGVVRRHDGRPGGLRMAQRAVAQQVRRGDVIERRVKVLQCLPCRRREPEGQPVLGAARQRNRGRRDQRAGVVLDGRVVHRRSEDAHRTPLPFEVVDEPIQGQ
jgi:hypothetical protein